MLKVGQPIDRKNKAGLLETLKQSQPKGIQIKEIAISYKEGDIDKNHTIGGGKFDGKMSQVPFTKTEGINFVKELVEKGCTEIKAEYKTYNASMQNLRFVSSNLKVEDLMNHPYIVNHMLKYSKNTKVTEPIRKEIGDMNILEYYTQTTDFDPDWVAESKYHKK